MLGVAKFPARGGAELFKILEPFHKPMKDDQSTEQTPLNSIAIESVQDGGKPEEPNPHFR